MTIKAKSFDGFDNVIRLDKLLKQMKTKKLKRAKAKCKSPGCTGTWRIRYAGPRAFGVHCDGTCGFSMMG